MAGNVWDQDLTDNDGYVAGLDDEAEELGMGDPHIDPRMDARVKRLGDSPLDGLEELGHAGAGHAHGPGRGPGGGSGSGRGTGRGGGPGGGPGRGRVKVAVMPESMKRAFPDAATLTMTSMAGRQKIWVRR